MSAKITNREKIREAYKKSGLTYDALSSMLGIKRNSLACYITGQRNPSDIVTNYIIEKVNNYINKGGEYINRNEYRDEFMECVYDICENNTQIAVEIMKAFDDLPTVSLKIDENGNYVSSAVSSEE